MKQSLRIKILMFISVVSVSFCCSQAYGQQIAVKTNSLAWLGLNPNLGFEIVTGERTSVDFMLMGHARPFGVESLMFTAQPEFRYWLGGRPMIHAFVGATAIVATYDMVMREQVRDSFSVGLGLTVGYLLPLDKKWNIEFSGGFGLLSYFQKQYYVEDNIDYFVNIPTKINSMGYKMLPIDIGVTITYIIK